MSKASHGASLVDEHNMCLLHVHSAFKALNQVELLSKTDNNGNECSPVLSFHNGTLSVDMQSAFRQFYQALKDEKTGRYPEVISGREISNQKPVKVGANLDFSNKTRDLIQATESKIDTALDTILADIPTNQLPFMEGRPTYGKGRPNLEGGINVTCLKEVPQNKADRVTQQHHRRQSANILTTSTTFSLSESRQIDSPIRENHTIRDNLVEAIIGFIALERGGEDDDYVIDQIIDDYYGRKSSRLHLIGSKLPDFIKARAHILISVDMFRHVLKAISSGAHAVSDKAEHVVYMKRVITFHEALTAGEIQPAKVKLGGYEYIVDLQRYTSLYTNLDRFPVLFEPEELFEFSEEISSVAWKLKGNNPNPQTQSSKHYSRLEKCIKVLEQESTRPHRVERMLNYLAFLYTLRGSDGGSPTESFEAFINSVNTIKDACKVAEDLQSWDGTLTKITGLLSNTSWSRAVASATTDFRIAIKPEKFLNIDVFDPEEDRMNDWSAESIISREIGAKVDSVELINALDKAVPLTDNDSSLYVKVSVNYNNNSYQEVNGSKAKLQIKRYLEEKNLPVTLVTYDSRNPSSKTIDATLFREKLVPAKGVRINLTYKSEDKEALRGATNPATHQMAVVGNIIAAFLIEKVVAHLAYKLDVDRICLLKAYASPGRGKEKNKIRDNQIYALSSAIEHRLSSVAPLTSQGVSMANNNRDPQGYRYRSVANIMSHKGRLGIRAHDPADDRVYLVSAELARPADINPDPDATTPQDRYQINLSQHRFYVSYRDPDDPSYRVMRDLRSDIHLDSQSDTFHSGTDARFLRKTVDRLKEEFPGKEIVYLFTSTHYMRGRDIFRKDIGFNTYAENSLRSLSSDFPDLILIPVRTIRLPFLNATEGMKPSGIYEVRDLEDGPHRDGNKREHFLYSLATFHSVSSGNKATKYSTLFTYKAIEYDQAVTKSADLLRILGEKERLHDIFRLLHLRASENQSRSVKLDPFDWATITNVEEAGEMRIFPNSETTVGLVATMTRLQDISNHDTE